MNILLSTFVYFFDVTKESLICLRKEFETLKKRNNKDKLFLRKCVLFKAYYKVVTLISLVVMTVN